ncbi:MAG: hypothetical protein M9894_09875 [Planctomycetes bacterium]|nr:hypothetical protein [Planctomycetota bacterium]
MTTDERLRRLCRATAGLGTDADRARLLVEQVRAGALTTERLALAAAFRHTVARLAVGPRWAAEVVPEQEDVVALVERLDLGAEARARVGLAAARVALAAAGKGSDLARVHAALTEWVRSGGRSPAPVEPRRKVLSVKFGRGVPPTYRNCYADGENLSRHLARVVAEDPAAKEDLRRVVNGARRWATGEVAALARDRGDWTEWWSEAGPAASQAVADAVRREVVPWALGEVDALV